jgi:RNase P/RNase MRP subunit p30
MFDLILFSSDKKIDSYAQDFYNVKNLPKNFFASSSDLQKARTIVKKVKFFHYQLYEPEQGLIKLMREHECTLVVALNDFFSISYHEMTKRLSRARVLIRIANNAKVSVRIFSLARNLNEIRDEYEMYWIGKMLGIDDNQIENAKAQKYEDIVKGNSRD